MYHAHSLRNEYIIKLYLTLFHVDEESIDILHLP